MDKRINEWLDGHQIGIDIFYKKYLLEGETFEEWLDRVTNCNLALKDLILQKKIAFGGRIFANRGTNRTTSNCFIFPEPEDSINGIMAQCVNMAKTYKAGGGVGFSLDSLRPKGAKINGQEQVHCGVSEFAPLFSSVTAAISGKGRRGALSMILSADHPNAKQFITLKENKDNGVEKANLSLKISNDFMYKMEKHTEEMKHYFVQATGEIFDYYINYEEIFDMIVSKSMKSAEPAMVFWDNANNHTLCSGYKEYDIVGLNPCMEVSGIAWDACLLGSINLAAYVDDNGDFAFDSFRKDVRVMVYALDEIQSEGIETLPLPEQREVAAKTRQIGLGFMGLATALMKMGIVYGSPKAVEFTRLVTKNMLNQAVITSANLATDRGTFEGYQLEKTQQSPLWKELSEEAKDAVIEHGLAHLKLLSIAPTGSISTMYNVSSGIEPYYATSYIRKTESLYQDKDKEYKVYIPVVQEYLDRYGEDATLPAHFFATAYNIHYIDRINMQAAAQKYVDNSISSTVNLPKGITFEEVKDLYVRAWKSGLKGITIYVDGSLDSQILKVESDTPVESPEVNTDTLYYQGTIYIKREIDIGCGVIRAFVGWDIEKQKIHDYYTEISESGGCASNIKAQAISNSLLIKNGQYTIQELLDKQNRVMACPSFSSKRGAGKPLSKGKNCGTAILHELLECEKEFKNRFPCAPYSPPITLKMNPKIAELLAKDQIITYAGDGASVEKFEGMQCPQCGEDMKIEGHCFQCDVCGHTICD